MKKFLKKKLGNEKGMTLIELLAVIVILAIIAAIAIPAIGNMIENSRVSAIKADAQMTLSAANLYFTEEGSPDGTIATLTQLEPYLDDVGSMQSDVVVQKKPTGNIIYGTGKASGGKTLLFASKTNAEIGVKTYKGDTALGAAPTNP